MKSQRLDPHKKAESVSQFEEILRKRIVGQDDAVDKVVDAFQVYSAGLNTPGRPLSNMLFLGPSGTGKTKTCETVAEALYGNPQAFLKVDCSEFQYGHEIAKLTGAPPSYLGHGDTKAMLCQENLNQYHTDTTKLTVLLFDEIEKAGDSFWRLLLGILDKATLTLGNNARVDFSKCFIFMTSNLGASEMSDLLSGGMGFRTHKPAFTNDANLDDKMSKVAMEAARRRFSPEFMNRLDKIVVFKTLRPEQLKTVIDMELGAVQQRILKTTIQFVFHCTAAAKVVILSEGTDPKYGARPLKRVIEKRLVTPFASMVATGQINLGDFIRVDVEDGLDEFTFTKEESGALIPAMLEKHYAEPIPGEPDGVPEKWKEMARKKAESNERKRRRALMDTAYDSGNSLDIDATPKGRGKKKI